MVPQEYRLKKILEQLLDGKSEQWYGDRFDSQRAQEGPWKAVVEMVTDEEVTTVDKVQEIIPLSNYKMS